MTVTTSELSVKLGWTITKANTGFGSSKQGPTSLDASGAPSTTTWNVVWSKRHTLAGGGTQTIDLQALVDAFGDTNVLTKALAIAVKCTKGLKIEKGVSNPLTWFLDGTTAPRLVLDANGFLLISWGVSGSGVTVDATHKTLLFTNTDGSNSNDVDIAILGGV